MSYQSPYSVRYGSEEMRLIWAETTKRRLWRRIWVAQAETLAAAGLVDTAGLEELKAHVNAVDLQQAAEVESRVGHDLVAELQTFARQCPIGGRYLHWGLTSADVLDNADVLLQRTAVTLLAGRLREVETPATIVFVAFGAHWQGAAGASFFVERLEDFERDALLGMIDLDTVAGGGELVAYGPEGDGGWLSSALAIAAERRGLTLTEAVAAAGGEHAAFAAAGVPYAGLVSADTVVNGRVDAEQPTAVAGTPRDTVRRLLAGDTGTLEQQLGDGARLLEELLTSTLEPPT